MRPSSRTRLHTPRAQAFLELPHALLLHAGSGRGDGARCAVAHALSAALASLAEEGASEWTQLCLRVAAERAQGAFMRGGSSARARVYALRCAAGGGFAPQMMC
jgi:hypothetical protein